jgi:hypothetical protein
MPPPTPSHPPCTHSPARHTHATPPPQALKELLVTKPPSDWVAALPAWVYAFKRSLLDPHKSVR